MLLKCTSDLGIGLGKILVKLAPDSFKEIVDASKPEPVKLEPVVPQKEPTLADLVEAVKRAKFEFPNLKAVCLSQWIVESGRGTSELFRKHFNAGGMKWRTEMTGYATPIEYLAHDGKDTYCKFTSLDDWIVGYWRFIERKPYAGWRNHANSAEAYITHLKNCGYAEDPVYIKKVLAGVPQAEKLLEIEAPKAEVPSQKQYRIFLDPGHAESKTGARSNDGTAQEEDLNRLQAAVIKKELEATGRFLCTIFDPSIDNLVEIGKAARGHDMSIHLHHNKYSGNEDPGTECLYDNDKAESQSKDLAKLMSATISKALGTKDRGAKPFAGTVMDYAEQQGNFPVVLPESYFLNPYTKQQAEERSTRAAIAIADTVKRWFRV